MTRVWIACLWIGFTLLCNPTLAQINRRQIVVLDPGQGGVDSGGNRYKWNKGKGCGS